MGRKRQVTTGVSISMSGRIADFHSCPCFEVLRLWGGPPSVTWDEQYRASKAQLARILGWARPGSTDTEALRSLRGRGARTRILKGILRQYVVKWDQGESIQADVSTCLAWVGHLRQLGIRDDAGLKRHLEGLGVVELTPKNALQEAVSAAWPALRSSRVKTSRKLGRSVLAALWGLADEESIKAKVLPRRSVGLLRAVTRDLTALETMSGALGNRRRS